MLRRQLLRQSCAISDCITRLPQRPRSRFSSASFASPRVTTAFRSQLDVGRRWQSNGGEEKKPEEQAAAPSPEAKEDPLKQELEKKSKEVVDLKDQYLRSVADYRNLQDRTKREMNAAKQYAIQHFATDLLDSIDNLDRALTSVPAWAIDSSSTASDTTSSAGGADPATPTPEPNKDLVNLYSGLKMTEEILLSTLKKHGLERFDPMEAEGRKFDPNTDEATFFTKVEGKEDGDIFFTQSKGFKLNGRVIRAAKVGVVKNS